MKSFKKLVLVIFSLAATIFLCGPAMAVPFTLTDSYDPSNEKIKCGESYSYTHDLTDGDNGYQFVVGQDVITGYTLTLALKDDGDRQSEVAYVNLPGKMSDGFYNFSYGNNEYGWSLGGLFSLNIFGTYSVTITSILGDFFFNSSTLTVKGERNTKTASVPEPAMMVLFGTGLVLFGFIGRKFKH